MYELPVWVYKTHWDYLDVWLYGLMWLPLVEGLFFGFCADFFPSWELSLLISHYSLLFFRRCTQIFFPADLRRFDSRRYVQIFFLLGNSHYSPLTTHYFLFPQMCADFSRRFRLTHYSPLTTHHSLLPQILFKHFFLGNLQLLQLAKRIN